MAGFFSLGSLTSNTAEQGEVGGGGTDADGGGRDNNLPPTQQGNNTATDPETNWLLYRNQEIAYKGLELWHQQQQQQTMQQQQRISTPDLYASAVRLGVGPSGSSSSIRNISAANHNNNNSDDQNNHNNNQAGSIGVRSIGGGGGGGGYNLMMRGVGVGASGSGGSGAVNCQDCGNQAKKDCIHMRCRTCCKSRGYHCPTHVKSTWVPASKRRERLQQQQQAEQQQPKRHRDRHHHHHASSSARPAPTATLSSAGMELQNFPSEVSTEALFRCVRVSPIIEDNHDEEQQQFAYQTAINIGGHTFKGILYDQGPADDHQTRYNNYNLRSSGGTGDSSSGTGEAPPPRPPTPLNLISSAPPPPPPTNTIVTSSSLVGSSPIAFLDPSLYQASMSSFLAGTQFFPHTRSP